MALELICPQCETEYWGPVRDAQCGECEHIFLPEEIHEALGYRSNMEANYAKIFKHG
jgi:hypothetical protein